MINVYTLGVGIPTTLQYSAPADISRDTEISTADLVQETMGGEEYISSSPFLLFPFMVWTAYSTSAGDWYGHQILLGIICSPIESLPEISIPELFFAHERGTYIGLYVFVLFGSNFIAPLVAGWFDDADGWRWTMHFGAIGAALAFFIIFFFMGETMYFRNTIEGLEVEQVPVQTIPSSELQTDEKRGAVMPTTDISALPVTHPGPRTYTQKLRLFLLLEG